MIRVLLCAIAIGLPGVARAQGAQLARTSEGVRLHLSEVGMIEGRVLERLLDGRSVKIDLSLAVADRPDGPALAQTAHTCTFSFDLWEERFAVSGSGAPARSISHLQARDAEAWCIDQLALPLPAFGAAPKDRPFWVRLDLHVADPVGAGASWGDAVVSIERLVDVLSRRRDDRASHRTIEAGPLRLAP